MVVESLIWVTVFGVTAVFTVVRTAVVVPPLAAVIQPTGMIAVVQTPLQVAVPKQVVIFTFLILWL